MVIKVKVIVGFKKHLWIICYFVKLLALCFLESITKHKNNDRSLHCMCFCHNSKCMDPSLLKPFMYSLITLSLVLLLLESVTLDGYNNYVLYR